MSPTPYDAHRDYFAHDHTQDSLEQLLQGYLTLGRCFHYKYETLERKLACFMRFLRGLSVTHPTQLTAPVALDFQHHLQAHYRPDSANRRAHAAKRFCEHLVRLGVLESNPFGDLPWLREPPFIPYIFTLDELARIFQHRLRTPPDDCRYFADWTHYCAYHTIYACGLRVSELSKLDFEHVDLDRRTLTIRRTKFGKDRIVPFNAKVGQNLQRYLELRRATFPHADTPAFWLSQRGNRLSRDTISGCFRTALDKLGLYRRDRLVDGVVYGSPRIHSLRHTFAVHRLLRWYREGADVNAKLPLLATYLGHLNFRHTLVYLNVCAATLRLANARFAKAFEDLFALWRTETTRGDFPHG